MNYVIIGNGVAGMEAALELRRRDEGGTITVISEESDHFFSRTALMYVVCGQLAHKDIEPLERDVYERLRLQRVRARATGVDPAAKTVTLAGGLPPVSYDKLLICCGSRPRPAPFWEGYDTLKGVGHLVTMQDLDWLHRELHGTAPFDAPERAEAHLAHTTDDSPYRPRPSATEIRKRPPTSAAVVGRRRARRAAAATFSTTPGMPPVRRVTACSSAFGRGPVRPVMVRSASSVAKSTSSTFGALPRCSQPADSLVANRTAHRRSTGWRLR